MSNGQSSSKLGGVGLVAAVIVLAAWFVFVLYLAFHSGAPEQQWARLTGVFSSIEAVAFGAAGALFGTSIQKQQIQDSKERAEQAEQKATDHADAAAKGRALATAVKAHAVARTAITAARPVDDLAAMAERLFPD